MHRLLIALPASLLLTAVSNAQRDAPVWESFLDRIAVFHLDRQSTNLEFVWQKGGGPQEHVSHQVHLLAYLEKNERAILDLMANPELMNKAANEGADQDDKPPQKILDVLLAKHLVTVLDTQVAHKIASEENAADPKTAQRANAYPFEFAFRNTDLFDRVAALPGFDAEPPLRNVGVSYTKEWFRADFKLMPFIPVNDCKYADRVRAEDMTDYDFTYAGPGKQNDGIAHYMRPLPYVFNLARISDGNVLVYVH